MELEFDKEIDSLLRAKGVLIGDTPPKGHLDADEIAAFAENAMPQSARALHLPHIAECDRCRKILSNLIAMNAEAETESTAAVVSVSAGVPWYRKLFVFPNLAYAMASLILVFGGLIALSLYQGLRSGGDTAVSQMGQSEAVRGPMAPTEPLGSNTTGSTANVSSNTAISMSNANAANAASAPSGASNLSLDRAANVAVTAPRSENELASPAEASPSTTDAVVSGDAPKQSQPAAAAPPPPKDDGLAKDDEKARAVAEQDSDRKKSASLSAKRKESISLDGVESRNVPRTQAGGVAKVTPGPTREMQQTFPNRTDNTFNLKSRRVGGKDFEFRNGAWYDTAYRNQATANVRRGTEEYRKLDGGLRSIAENLSGVVVTLWGGKAYRIQ